MSRTPTLNHVLNSCLVAAALYSCAGRDDASSSRLYAEDSTQESTSSTAYAKDGFFVEESDGRLWVFTDDSESVMQFKKVGEPGKFATLIGVGPGGMTMRSDSRDSIICYLAAKKGFHTEVVDNRLWILESGSKSLEQFQSIGEPAKNATFIGKGPMRITVRTDSKDTFIKYIASRKGFWTEIRDNRLWILEEGSESHKQMIDAGDIAQNVTLIGKGPMNISIRSDDKSTVLKWAAMKNGFNTYIRDGRIWVFKPGSEHEAVFLEIGEPAKSITKIGAGPLRSTVRAAEMDVMQHYLRSL